MYALPRLKIYFAKVCLPHLFSFRMFKRNIQQRESWLERLSPDDGVGDFVLLHDDAVWGHRAYSRWHLKSAVTKLSPQLLRDRTLD